VTREEADHVASAVVCFAAAATLGYALQRLGAAWHEPDPRTIGPSLHVPYFWRCATALWWGGLAALAGFRWPGVGARVERAFPVVLVVAVGVAVFVP
jgi:hypothetical protein